MTIPIETDAHLVKVSRYIHVNPVAAGLVDAPQTWRWSSAKAYLGLEPPVAWLQTEHVLSMFSNLSPGNDYASYLSDGVDAETAKVYTEHRL